ncbi:hypothetical protein HHJ02_01070 [Akkermansia muciniphila]|uniref:ADP-ribosyltransferase-containing protein n=1 Tax=Akkermansia muciniphila TaxID=239935 RepID=UPI001BFF61E8|nr:hypothetical protein [Akkermansia muciniphila]MBT8789398.1 hypothetical protein [Akkermansia muciniphila]WPK61643.1 hypothetical protein PE433_08055 [Akkermansia muciniphila]
MSSGVPLDMQNTDDLRSRDELVEKIDPSFNPDMSQWDVSPDLFDHGAEELPDFSNPEESLRLFASYAFNAGIAEREKAREKKLTTMRDIVLYYDGDKGARERLRQVWGDVDMERLDMLDQEGKLPELSLRLLETYGDGDYRRGGDDYLSDNDLWRDKESVNVSGIWNHFKKKVNFMVQAENRMRELREREHVNLSDSAKRYVLGGENALEAEERLGLFNAGVDFASLNRVRRAVSYIDRYVRDGNLFNDHMADELAEILGRDEDARTMFRRILFEKSRDTAGKRMGVTEAPQVAEGTGALAKTGEYMARVAAAIPAAPSGMWDHFTRSLETYRQNLKDTGREEMNPFEADRLREHFRKQGLNSKEIARRVADIQFEREKRKKDRVDIESLIAAALEGGEGEFLESASFLNRVSYKLGGLIGDWAPMAVPYAGWHLMFGSAAQRARMEGANMGLEEDERELRSLFRGASAASVEKIAFGGFGKMVPGFHKIQQWAGRGNAASWRARFASSPKAQMAGHAAMGVAEEAFLEPTAEYIMNSATDLFLNDERGKATFSGYLQEMQAMLEPDQFAALALFSVGMSSLNYGQLSRDSARFRDMLTAYKASGGTEAGLLDAMKQPDMKGALEKAVSHLHDAWMEDPQASMERASAAAGERLSGERIESLRELDAWRAAEDAGMVPRVEPAEQEGMFRVYAPRGVEKGRPETKREDSTATTGQQEESNQPSYTLMNGEQMTAYLQAFVSEQVESDILYTQHLLAGDVTVSQALAQGRFDAAEVITRTVTDEKTGAERVVIAPETLGQMKARADMAMAAIRALEAEGVSYEDAAARMDASLSEHLPLGTLVKTWEEAQERIRTEQARNPEFKAPAMDAPFSNAYVTKVRRGDTFRRVLRYARGNATVEDLMEEAMEQAVISWQAEQGLTWGEFGAMLQEAQRVMNELFPEARGEEMQFIHLDAGKPVTGHDAIEAFSKIGRSRWLADAVNHPSLPSWLRKLLNHLVKFLGAFKARVELGEMVRQAEEQGVFTLPVRQALAVMLDAGNALYRDQQGDLIALTMERAKAQADLDAALGRGVATEQETLEEQLAERNAADEPGPVDRAEEEADDANAQQARRERTEAEVEMLGERDDDGVFNGGVSIRIEDGVRQGFIDKDRLTLCPDVPQFKQGADEKTGVVNRIVGAWQRNAAPISVWRRTDGSLQVISGRHRLDACTDADINCTVYEEGERFDLDWARRHDVENNIRDGQASAFEIARYVRDSSLSMAEAVERGIARKGASLKGVELGLYASQELLDALGNGLISPDDAYRVALAFRNDAEVQRSGLAVLLDGGSWQEAYNTMAAKANLEAIARQNAANGMDMGMDLFGNTDNEELYKRIGKYAAEKYRELGKELTAINGASRNPKVARKYGVNVNDAAAVQQVVKRLQEERSRWKNFAVHPDLLKEANNAVMVEMGLKSREDVDRENGVLPLEVSDDSSPVANFSLVSIPSSDVITTAAEMRARLKPLQGKVFVNKNTGIQAVIEARVSGKTVGKAGAAQMSVANLKALGFSAEEARRVHYTAAARIHELFENAEDGFFEEAYKQDASKAGAYHFFNTVDIEGIGAFDVNVTAIKYVKEQEGNVLYTLELTIENPATRGAASREGRLPTPFKDGVSTRNLSSYRSFVEKEKAAVRKKAVADGTFMKAPNGANTNLTEDQWLSVRTAAFKNWFGDWEHDPENASKVVDENGEPRVVYHGTYGDFTVFDKAMIGSATDYGLWGRGFYFTNMENTPYGNKKLALFLNFRNPFIFNDYKSAEEIGDYLNIWDGNFHEDDRFGIFRPYATGAAQIADSAQERGHDGLIAVLGKWTEYIAFEPNQIKSATDNRGTFDSENPDITFSIASAQEQGLFHDGHFEAGNAVITDPTATFSIIGEKAESFQEYHNNGLSYTDPADGKRKAIIDSRGVRLRKEHVSVSEGGHVNVSLAAALDFPELFRAYPELRRLRVDFYRDSGSGTGGFTDPQEHYIAVNVARGGKNADAGMVLDTILHEVQHVIQGYEGFAQGAGSMSREQALAYLGGSMSQLAGRGDDWAKEALPRLERMRQELENGTLQPAFVYVFSHGEQEARLAGRFEKNSEGVVMSGLNGFRLLDAPQFSIPLTGDITELGGITFGAGRFGRVADRVLAPNGDWLYDEMVFRMRAAMQRSVSKLRLYETGDRERGLELLAEAQELISTVERYLPGSYGFGLEPYKIWLNVFSLLYGNSGKMAPGDAVASALEAIPMKRWPEIMEGSIGKSFVNWAEKRPELEDVVEEARREIAERQADYELDSAPDADNRAALAARKGVEQEVWRRLFEEHGAEFLEEYGERKVFRLVGKFMERVVEQIDRFRKDRTLGRIRRVAASVAPRTNPKGKPLRGKMDAESYRRLERCLRLLEMTESQYDEFFQKNFPEDAEEGKRWEDLAPDALVLVTLPDAEGRLEEVAVTQREFEVYACYERMDVNTAEKCGAALGELIATSRHAWENAAEKKKMEVAAMAAPLLQATGDLDDSRMATFRRKARLRALPKKPLSLFDYLMNFNQYMQALSSVGPFAGIARQFEERAARFNVQRQASEKEMLRFVHNTVAEIAGSADRYDIAEWIYEGRMKQDTGISVVEREPDWNRKANALYRERLLHLLRRKVKSHGLEAVQLYLREFKFSEGLKKEVNALFGHRRKEISAKQAKKALEHMERVFTQNEWERYGDQKVFVRERAEMLRSRTKYAKEGYQPKSFRLDGLSRMEAAYLVLLSEQADYTEALAERGFDAEVMDRLRGFAGDEVMQFAYALREKLNERSGQVQEMTERRYGTPFPLTENYFRAFFDVTMEAIDKSIADAASYGEAATGGKFGLIHARRKHQAHLDLEMDVCTAFMAAMTEQDLYLYGSEISRDLRALLNFKGEDGEAGRSLEVLLGRDAVGKLMAWADAFDRAGAESIRGHLDMNRLMNRLSGAAARVLLAGRVGTLTKQATTVINAMYASDEIGLAEWLGSVRRYHAGKLVKPVREIEALPELDSRDKTRFSATLAAMGADEAGRRVSRLERWNREGMDLLERVDMKGNAISAAILYDAVYRKMKRETPDAAEAELDAAAMAEVRRSLSRKGQPMTQLQKSLTAQHRTWMQAGMLFLGGESINTMGNVFSLARSGQWGKAGLMWVSHGVVLALLNGLLNFMTDDEKRRRKREWWHALFDVAMGPVMGIPVVSGLAGEGVRQLAKLCGYHAFMPGNNLLVPFSNAADIGKAFSNAWKVFDGKERPWEDDALSFHELLRTAAAGTVAFSPRTTKGRAAAVGAALTMAALLNVTEFALKTVRSVQENGADWDKWVGK